MPDTKPPVIGVATVSTTLLYDWNACGPVSLRIRVSVTDDRSGVASVRVRLRNAQTGGQLDLALTRESKGTYWGRTLAFADVGQGTYSLSFQAVDKAGNQTPFVAKKLSFSADICVI